MNYDSQKKIIFVIVLFFSAFILNARGVTTKVEPGTIVPVACDPGSYTYVETHEDVIEVFSGDPCWRTGHVDRFVWAQPPVDNCRTSMTIITKGKAVQVVCLKSGTLADVEPTTIGHTINLGESYCDYHCRVGEATTICLPKGVYEVNASDPRWRIRRKFNIICLSPNEPESAMTLTITGRNGKSVIMLFYSHEREGLVPTDYMIKVDRFPGTKSKLLESDPVKTTSQESSDAPPPQPTFATEGELQLSGGYETGGSEDRFTMKGSGVFAARTRGGLFFQGAGIVDIASDYKQYGISAGIGLEPGSLGLFLFADGLIAKEGNSDPNFHFQLRPALRVKTNRFAGSLFFAKAVTRDQYLGQEGLQNGIRYGLFQEAIDHAGLDLAARLGRRLMIELRTLVGKDLVQLEGTTSYKLLQTLYLNAGYAYTHTNGSIRGLCNGSRIFAGITVGMGSEHKFKNLKRSLIMRPDYPIVRSVEKKLKSESEEVSPLKASLAASPLSGNAPLKVTFSATATGGRAPFKCSWTIDDSLDSSLEGMNTEKTFTNPGTYRVAVIITDSEGQKATSNTVVIDVNQSLKQELFSISATAGPGGSIDPAGTIQVKAGESKVFFMKPQPGYRVNLVKVDGKTVGNESTYKFETVSANHSIHVEFARAEDRSYKIVASSDSGGSISPEGTVPVSEGSEASFSITPQSGFRVKQVKVDGKILGAVSDYKFENIADDHEIHAEFEPETHEIYTIVSTAGPGGSIDPLGTTLIVAGENLTVTILPAEGFEIASVTVDGKTAGAITSYTFANIDADHTIHAEFTETVIPTFTINASAGPGGSVSPAGTVEVPQNSNASFVVRPIAGYRILSVIVDGANVGPLDEYTFKNVTDNHTIHATFQRITHTITATAGQGGVVDPAGNTTVNQGDSRTITITPATGYRILDVRVDGKGVGAISSYTFSNISADHTLQATFKKKTFTVTATAGSGGGIDPSGTTMVEYSDALSFAITPAVGYKIQDVLVDGKSKGALTSFTFSNITANHTIEARFEILRFTIQAASSSGGSIKPGGVITVEYGQSRSFRMESNDPLVYELDTVMVDGKPVGPVTSYNFANITSDHTIRASWKKRQYNIDASATTGGTITPTGTRFYTAQSTPTYTITPAEGYEIDRVIIDGIYQAGKVNSYTFNPLYANHTIRAVFKRKSYNILIRKAYSDGSTGAPPNPVDPIGEVTVNHGESLEITIDNHFQGGDSSAIYSLDYISVDGNTSTYRGDTKRVIIHTVNAVKSNKEVVCYFYRRTN